MLSDILPLCLQLKRQNETKDREFWYTYYFMGSDTGTILKDVFTSNVITYFVVWIS